jgi:hypothetical protein
MLLVLLVPGIDHLSKLPARISRTIANMQYEIPFAPHYNLYNNVFEQGLFPVDPRAVLTVDLARLRYEKAILEDGLATCVTYLHVLRKKQARNERLLNHDSPSTRKRKKKMQQGKRELDREIKNKSNDERAFLGALQTCKANLYIAERLSYTPTDMSSTLADCTSSTTQYSCDESEPAEISWNGWTEDALSSPFQKRRSNPLHVNEVAPDEAVDPEHDIIEGRGYHRAPPLSRAHSYHCHCLLSAEAPTFTPSTNPHAYIDTDTVGAPQTKTDDCTKVKEARRYTEAGVTRAFEELSINTQGVPDGSNTWCTTTPQRSPRRETIAGVMQRRRSSIV